MGSQHDDEVRSRAVVRFRITGPAVTARAAIVRVEPDRRSRLLTAIAADKSSSIVFPLPMDIVMPLIDALKRQPG